MRNSDRSHISRRRGCSPTTIFQPKNHIQFNTLEKFTKMAQATDPGNGGPKRTLLSPMALVPVLSPTEQPSKTTGNSGRSRVGKYVSQGQLAEGARLRANRLWEKVNGFNGQAIASKSDLADHQSLRPPASHSQSLLTTDPSEAAPFSWNTFFARSTPMMLTSPIHPLSFNLCFDTTSMAHRDAVRGERHPPHLWRRKPLSYMCQAIGWSLPLHWPVPNSSRAVSRPRVATQRLIIE